jgi:hypothetical protein
MAKKDNEVKIDYNQDFKEYELARGAAIAEQSEDKVIYSTVIPSLKKFYDQYQMGQRPLSTNTFIAAGFNRAVIDMQERGRIGDRDFLEALNDHNKTYNEALGKINIKTIMDRSEANGYKISTDFKRIAMKYNLMTLKQLENAAKKDNVAESVYAGISRLENDKFYGSILGKVSREQTDGILKGLVKVVEESRIPLRKTGS